MPVDYICTSIPGTPDTWVGCLSQIFSLILMAGLFMMVLMSKKYRHATEWLLKKLDRWF